MQLGDSFEYSSIAITLVFEGDIGYTLRWHLYDDVECLSSSPWSPDGPKPSVRIINVSSHWRDFVGHSLVEHLSALGDTGLGPAQVWTTRLIFDSGRSLTIALGELLDDGTPSYLPDALVITGDEMAARGYVRRDGSTAWIESPRLE